MNFYSQNCYLYCIRGLCVPCSCLNGMPVASTCKALYTVACFLHPKVLNELSCWLEKPYGTWRGRRSFEIDLPLILVHSIHLKKFFLQKGIQKLHHVVWSFLFFSIFYWGGPFVYVVLLQSFIRCICMNEWMNECVCSWLHSKKFRKKW